MYTTSFYDEITEIEMELNEAITALETFHPSRIMNDTDNVLLEAIDYKDKIKVLITKLIDAIQKYTETFKGIMKQLKEKNKEWIQIASLYQITDIDSLTFKYEMFPYWDGFDELKNTKIPNYTESDDDLLVKNNGAGYRGKYFSGIVDKNSSDNSIANAKNIFRGSDEKIKISGLRIPTIYRKALSIIKNYDSVANEIIKSNDDITRLLKTAQQSSESATVNESALLDITIFQDDIFYTLIEDAITPSDIEKETKQEDENPEQPTENNKNADIKTGVDAIIAYSKQCYAVNSMRMDILEEAYTACVNFINTVMNMRQKKEKSDEV